MAGGNACWRQREEDPFTIRSYDEYHKVQYKYHNQFLKRINGELCIYNTIQIIQKYQPKVWVIENPAFGRIWKYIKNIIGYEIPHHNLTYYSAYGYMFMKPTKFASNIDLGLRTDRKPNTVKFTDVKDYNTRSNIPLELIMDILQKIHERGTNEKLSDNARDTSQWQIAND